MKLNELLALLESIRLMADDAVDSLDKEAVKWNIIHALEKYINNTKVEEKIDEIPF